VTHRDKLLEIKKQIEDSFDRGEFADDLNDFNRQMMNIEMALHRYPLDNNNNNDEYKERTDDK